jgi:hypothetical protein
MNAAYWHLADIVVPSFAVIVAALITHQKLDVVHMLVNDRLTKALQKISDLETRLSALDK